ncbi:Resistin-Like Beta [Manis pentadactyla]|nr:Resistin-Like Beta [Manis pentadactyla]
MAAVHGLLDLAALMILHILFLGNDNKKLTALKPEVADLTGVGRGMKTTRAICSPKTLPVCRMKPTSCFLLILIPLIHLMILGNAQCSLDSTVDKKIKAALTALGYSPTAPSKKMSRTAIQSSGRLSSCPAGTIVTGCAVAVPVAPGMRSVVDWPAARGCSLA